MLAAGLDRHRLAPRMRRTGGRKPIAALVEPSKVVAIALNTSFYPDDDEARRIIAETEARTGLPTDDPYRFGPGPLFARIREAVEALA